MNRTITARVSGAVCRQRHKIILPSLSRFMEKSIKHDEQGRRFSLIVDGQEGGYLIYELYDGRLDIQHTVVKSELRGNKLGAVLLAAAVEYAEGKGLKIIPTCSYAKKLLAPDRA